MKNRTIIDTIQKVSTINKIRTINIALYLDETIIDNSKEFLRVFREGISKVREINVDNLSMKELGKIIKEDLYGSYLIAFLRIL